MHGHPTIEATLLLINAWRPLLAAGAEKTICEYGVVDAAAKTNSL
jgi:hypothetical protein